MTENFTVCLNILIFLPKYRKLLVTNQMQFQIYKVTKFQFIITTQKRDNINKKEKKSL